MSKDLPEGYYLNNVTTVFRWVASRYSDLLSQEERHFLASFELLSRPAQALLARLLMRTRPLVRISSLRYDDISDVPMQLKILSEAALIELPAFLSLNELTALATRSELVNGFFTDTSTRGLTKASICEALATHDLAKKTWLCWLPDSDDDVVRLLCRSVCDRLRLIFFGNLHQDWSEFVVTDLGHLRYETVHLDDHARGFMHRLDVEQAERLHGLRQALVQDGPSDELLHSIQSDWEHASALTQARRQKLLFHVGQAAEKIRDWKLAHAAYVACDYPGAGQRRVRVLEKLGQHESAYTLGMLLFEEGVAEGDAQALHRTVTRLAKRLMLPAPREQALSLPELALCVLDAPPAICVELSAAEALAEKWEQVFYVENTLITAVFGLAFWDVIFKPLPGAFFHPFQAGPADLFHPDFCERRKDSIQETLAAMARGELDSQILAYAETKRGIQNFFVSWRHLDADVLKMALVSIPRAHWHALFSRLLTDLKNHRSGLPDLVCFGERNGDRAYAFVEVKGPGDRVQDNQSRWMHFFQQHGMPCQVLQVRWPIT